MVLISYATGLRLMCPFEPIWIYANQRARTDLSRPVGNQAAAEKVVFSVSASVLLTDPGYAGSIMLTHKHAVKAESALLGQPWIGLGSYWIRRHWKGN